MLEELWTDRFARVVTGAILLWLTASAAFALLFGIVEAHPLAALLLFAMSAMLGFGWAGVQSVLYSLLMEFCVWRVIGVNLVAVLVSSLLGLVCGSSVFFLFAKDFFVPLLFAGFVAGLLTGLALYLWKRRERASQAPAPPVGAIT
jgi:MFS family permease